MHHPRPGFDEAFVMQIRAQLSRQRDELDRLRRSVKAASTSSDENVKTAGRRSLLRLGDIPSTRGSLKHF
jgi:hypothetical protein